MPPFSIARLLTLVLTASAGVAQTAPAWTVLDVPGGVQTVNVQSLGKVIAYPESGVVHAYSGFARRWVSQATTTAPVRVSNDSVFVAAVPVFHAFSAYTGAWASVTLSPAAQVINPANQRNDSIWLVRDGADIWAFNAFRGNWRRLSASANAIALVERHTALVVDGSTLYGFSAFRDGWVAQAAAAAPTFVRAGGTTAVALVGGTIHGFSALRNAWASHAAPGASPAWSFGDDLVVASVPGASTAFSGLRGTFANAALPGTVSVQTSDVLAYVSDGTGQHWAYSALTGQWTALPFATTPIVLSSATTILLSMTDRVHAYSAITGTTSTALGAVSFSSVSRAVGAMVLQSGAFKLFSAVLGQWFDAPADAVAQPPELCDTAALFHTQTGIAAFSGRTGRMTRTSTGGGVNTHVNASSAILAAVDGTNLLVYDARRERWLVEALIGVPQVTIWRTTLVVTDNGGLRALGFGSFHGRIETITLPQPALSGRANSESGRLDFPQAIYGFSCDPDVLTLWQYPDFHRVFVGGCELDVRVQGPNTGTGFFFLATRVLTTPVPIAGLGDLELDPATLLLLTALPVPMVQGHGELRFPVPDDPGLRGLEIAFQALVVPGVGNAYLSQSTGIYVF